MANTKVQSEQIEDGSITADKIADGAIVATELADNAVTTAKINADAVTGAKIADDAINSEHYTDGSIDTAHIADDQVTQAKMANDSVGADELASNAVVTASIVDANVTTAKIADGNISTAKIADNAVTSAKIDTNIDIAGTLDVTGATVLDSTLTVKGATVFNEDSADVDFRVESNDSANMLFVDGGNNKVLVEANNTASVTDSASMVAASAFEINGNASEGSDILRFFAMADATGNYGLEVSNSGGNAQYGLCINPINGGNVGIGTTSPSYELHVEDDATETTIAVRSNTGGTGSAVGGRLRLQLGAQNNSGSGQADTQSGDTLGEVLFEGQGTDYSYQGGSIATIVTTGDGTATRSEQATAMTFGTMSAGAVSYAERMRIESTGDIRFNIANAALTAGEVHTFYNVSRGNNLGLYTQGGASMFSIDMWNHTGGTCKQVQFRSGQHGAVVGSITSTGDNATQYNTSSDYRLKENVSYTWDATTRLKQLKPAQFNWITDETNTAIDGFLAHEVSSVVPQAVTGEKDAVYEDGEPKYQGIDHSVLVPLLVKAIQEQQTIIEDLKARIEALES